MSNTVNNYTETDLGNISLNPRGEYDSSVEYEYLDAVSYQGGSYFCLAELETTITGIAPDAGHNSEHWQMIAAPGDMTPEYTAAYNDVIKKAVQVEISRAAVELAQQEIETSQADVQELHSDTVQAAQEAENSKNSAANSAQSAEQSKNAASESEQNVNNTLVAFDDHVKGKKSEADAAINKTKDAAIKAVTDQQSTSVQAVKDQTASYIAEKEISAKTEIGNYTSEKITEINKKASEANITLANTITDGNSLKTQLETTISTADTSKKNLDASNTAATKTKADLDTSNTTATKTKADLDTSNTTASETKTGLDATNKTAAGLVTSLGDKIAEGTQVKNDIQTTGETAMSNLQAEAAKQQEYIKASIDDTLSISGKAADAAVTGKKISSLEEDGSNKITKFYASNLGETHITDSDNGKIQDMMLYGKSSQDGTPTPENPVEIKSVVNPTVKVCGKNFYSGSDLIDLTKAYVTDFIPVILHKGKICISFDAFSDTSNGNYLINVEYFDANKESIGSNGKADLVRNNISHINFNFDESTAGYNNEALDFKNVLYVKVKFYIYANTATEITYKNIMISATDFDFEPYKPIQTVTIPYTLNAIHVKSGGNVTIDGQQYIADYVDVEHGKVIRNILKWRLGDFKYGFNNAVWHINISELGIDGSKIGLSNMFKIQNGNYNGVTASELYIAYDGKSASLNMRGMTDEEFKKWLREKNPEVYNVLTVAEEIPITPEEALAFKQLMTYYQVTNIGVNSEQLDGYTVFNYPISMVNGWNYVKQQLNDNRDYIYDMDLQSAEAYVNSEYAVALTELEV